MQTDRSKILQELIEKSVNEFEKRQNQTIKTVSTQETIFDIFVQQCLVYHEQPAHTLTELRQVKSKKAKGDVFELFCCRFLKSRYDNVWLLKDLTHALKTQLKLPLNNADYGIDIVCEKRGAFSAVQCKFKAPSRPRNISFRKKDGTSGLKTIYPCVNWSEIATFNSLCEASGPWKERITMTTAPSVRRLGGIKNPADKSICCGTFRSLSLLAWREMMKDCTNIEQTASSSSSFSSSVTKRPANTVLSLEELRAKRCRYFEPKEKKDDEEDEEREEGEEEEEEEKDVY